jgi:dienelactone hydrolase
MDWAEQQNGDPCSKYYRKLEVMNIGAMGQSCGGLHAYAVSADPRISTLVIWNSGLLDPDQSILDKLHSSCTTTVRTARAFSGADCGLCKSDWMVQKKNID